MHDNIYDIDDFWDIAPRLADKPKSEMQQFSTKPKVTLIEDLVDEKKTDGSSATDETLISTFSASRPNQIRVYEPTDAPLVRCVLIRQFDDRYDFYDGFRKSALLYYDVRGQKCDFVPFYSYMPQYAQMNEAQKGYYFYLRDEIRKGNYPKADYSYIYLYVYEILNLPEKISPDAGIRLLCDLWRAYRKALPRIDKFFSVWVEDYCLVWQLPSPASLVSDFIYDILKECTLSEFYLSDIRSACLDGVLSLVSVLSDYDWRSGRYATGESAKAYRAHMEGALSYVLSALLPNEIAKIQEQPTEKIVRDAFINSLCTHSVKCRLEIEYHSLSSLRCLREKITGLVKYIENQLRKSLGIKSRLSIKDLPKEYTELVDIYFNTLFEKARTKTKAETVPEYEKQYDAPTEELSISNADEIERTSWETTYRLVSDDVREEEFSLDDVRKFDEELSFDGRVKCEDMPSEHSVLTNDERQFLHLLLSPCPEEAFAFVKANALSVEYLLEQINTKAYDAFGDIIIESSDDGFMIIEDYREDIDIWLSK